MPEPRDRLLRRLGRADRWAFDRVAAARLRGLEYVLPRLSRFADHGVLWFTAAGVMGAMGRPRLRRAALRGSVALAVASPMVNVLGKHAFRRKRPVVDLVPPMRIRWKLPTSHAFPSGHSASAAAFAAGVALEAPGPVAVPVAVTAAAVGFSRVYTGAHYPGDVLAGAGIGALAALGTRLVWPVHAPGVHARRRRVGVGRPWRRGQDMTTDDTVLGVDPGDLTDDDLFRELGHLYATRLDALRHAADQAYGEHTRRMNRLEAEYVRRFPGREIDPERLREGARAR
ncbi:MAG: DUF6158 family protein [Spirillospora sp.]